MYLSTIGKIFKLLGLIMQKKIGIFLVSLGILSGCSTTPSDNSYIAAHTPKKLAIEEIKEIAVEARDELRLLAKYQQALASKSLTDEQHRQKYYQSVYVPDGFDKIVDLNIKNKASVAAKAIATIAGYEPDIINYSSVIDPMVNINIKNKPLNEALKELGLLTGSLIDIQVYPASRTMVIKFQGE